MRPNQSFVIVAVVLVSATLASTVDRAWQAGTWKDVQVKRPKVVFGVAPADPTSGGFRPPPPTRETRLYVIETDDLRLELKQDATVDTPRLDVLVGEPVTFAIEKNTVYVKDAKGHETKLSVTKKTSKK
jgi:hypothetical protein